MKQSTMDKKTWKNQGEKTPDLIERRTRINLRPHGRKERKNKKNVASELASISDANMRVTIFHSKIVFEKFSLYTV